jgi:hypothetical protein
VLLDLSQTATIEDSKRLGRAVLGEIGHINTLHKRHVEQAGFAVLKAPDIPSVLIETAFISNPEEEARLADEDYQWTMARAIAGGVKRWFAKTPGGLARARAANVARVDTPASTATPGVRPDVSIDSPSRLSRPGDPSVTPTVVPTAPVMARATAPVVPASAAPVVAAPSAPAIPTAATVARTTPIPAVVATPASATTRRVTQSRPATPVQRAALARAAGAAPVRVAAATPVDAPVATRAVAAHRSPARTAATATRVHTGRDVPRAPADRGVRVAARAKPVHARAAAVEARRDLAVRTRATPADPAVRRVRSPALTIPICDSPRDRAARARCARQRLALRVD